MLPSKFHGTYRLLAYGSFHIALPLSGNIQQAVESPEECTTLSLMRKAQDGLKHGAIVVSLQSK